MALKIKDRAKVTRTYNRFVLSGIGGLGKSTALGTIAKRALIIDLNKRFPRDLAAKHDFLEFTETYSGLKDAINSILAEPKLEYDFIVVDTLTDVMRLIKQHAITVNFSNDAEKYNAYTNGDKNYSPQYMNEVLTLLDKVAEKHHINIGLICHTIARDQKNVHGKDFGKQCLDLPERVAAVVLQWCDYAGFCYFDVEVQQDGLKRKARGQSRVLSFNDNPAYEAKNGSAFPLPEKIDFDREGKWADLVFGKRPLVNELDTLLDQYPEEKKDEMRAKFEAIGFRTMPDDQLKGLIDETKKYLKGIK